MNIEKIAEEIGIDTKTLLQLIDLFVQQTDVDLESIHTAVAEKKWEEVRKSAHSIKGAALNLELEEIAKTAKELEYWARDEQIELIPSAVDSLNRLFGELKQRLPGE